MASVHGTMPAFGRPTAIAPYMSGRPATSATATFPGSPRRFNTGEYANITTRAAAPTSTAVPLTRAAAANPTNVPPATHRSAVPRASRPAASGRGAQPRVERRIAQHREGARGHRRDIPARCEETGLPVHDHFRQASDGARHHRHRARHRLEGGEPERFRLGWQEEQVAASQD